MREQFTPERFWAGLDRTGECWLWTGPVRGNVGRTWDGDRRWQVHILAWTLTKGPVPAGSNVLQHCGNRLCCNPAHLYLGKLVKPYSTPEHFWRRLDKSGECWVWTGGRMNEDGYGGLKFGGRKWGAHQLAYTLAYGPIPDNLCVLHHCDNPPCCRPDHLFLGDRKANNEDKAEKERAPRGEQNAQARLNRSAVECIRQRYAAGGCTLDDLAREYGVSGVTIHKIIHRERWGWVA